MDPNRLKLVQVLMVQSYSIIGLAFSEGILHNYGVLQSSDPTSKVFRFHVLAPYLHHLCWGLGLPYIYMLLGLIGLCSTSHQEAMLEYSTSLNFCLPLCITHSSFWFFVLAWPAYLDWWFLLARCTTFNCSTIDFLI